MDKPGVLHISTARSWRGGEQQIAYLALELQKEGWNQHIVCIKEAPLHKWAEEHKIPVLALKKRSSLDLSFAKQIRNYAQSKGLSLLHAHDAHAHGFAVYAKALFGLKAKLIVSRRVDFPVAQPWLRRFKYNHKVVDKYLAVSEAIANILRQSIEDTQKVFTVHSAVDPAKIEKAEIGQFRQEFPEHHQKFWIGNVAALVDHKDQRTFLQTAAKLLQEQSDLHFFIAGSGELQGELENLSKELGLSDHVNFLGFRENVGALLKDLDCFLFTSKMEGLGTSILDAFAARLPVVATEAGGIPEMVIHEETGLLAPVGNSEALAQEVLRIKESEELRVRLTQAAKHKLKEFSPQEMAKSTIGHYLN